MAFVTGLTEVASGTGHWFLTGISGDAIAIDDPITEFFFPTIRMIIDLRSTTDFTITFSGPPAPLPADSIGFHSLIQMEIINDSGTTLNGLDLNLSMIDPHLPFSLVPGIVEFGHNVNANYAYFTDIHAGAFSPETMTLFSPDGKVTADAGVGVAASEMKLTGPIAPGQHISGDFTIHNTELTTGSNDFRLTIRDLPANFLITNVTTNVNSQASGNPYIGPVVGIQNEIIRITKDNLNISAATPNVFIHTGDGDDALDVSAVGGVNVLDGGTGSNFMVGAATGHDTFYVDDRNPSQDIWTTIKNFHSGDDATVWGITQADFKIAMLDNQGAVGATGLTFSITAAGHPNANLTLSGLTTADLPKLNISFGHTGDLPGLPGSDFMLIHAV